MQASAERSRSGRPPRQSFFSKPWGRKQPTKENECKEPSSQESHIEPKQSSKERQNQVQLSSSNLPSLQQDGQLDNKFTITAQPTPSRTQEKHDLANFHIEELSLHQYTTSEVLWSQAYQDLQRDMPDIIVDYKLYLSPDESNFKAGDRMNVIVNQIYSKRNSDELVLKLAGKSFKVREIGEKIINFVWESKQTITAIASVEPHTALAWSGIPWAGRVHNSGVPTEHQKVPSCNPS